MGDVVLDLEKHPGEEFGLIADFAEVLSAGAAIVSAVVSAVDSSGADASGTILNGSATISSPRVIQPVKLGADLEDYTVTIRGVTNETPAAKWDQRFLIKVRARPLTAASLVTTGLDANSYVTLTEAETYLTRRLRAEAWETAAKRDKVKALLHATRDIDALPFRGDRAELGFDAGQPTKMLQPLAFPRDYTVDGNGDSIVPQEVKDAQCEQALWLLLQHATGSERRLHLQAQGVTSFSVEGMSETYRATGGMALHPWSRLCPDAQRLLSRHVDFSFRLTRGGGTALYDLNRLRLR